MPYLTQIHILELSASCQTVRKLVVFRDHKWSTPNEGYLCIVIFSYSPFSLVTPALILMFLLRWLKY
jgi:hypothetical protein